MIRLISLWLLLNLPLLGWAEHIIGGELSMQSLGKPGYYRIQMNQFWDEEKAVPAAQEAFLQIHIFRKQNPVLMATYYLDRRSKNAIPYENEPCARAKKLTTLNAVFTNNIQLETERYTDPGGYYIVWERCCRNNAITNLANPVGVGMLFYLEFPALLQNGVPITNSSPSFTTPIGNYICLNRPFTTIYSATDADGDELRYSLVTPFQGYTDLINVVDNDGKVHANYPLVSWGPGYSATNAIQGTPSLGIDATTGRLTVTASQLGYYLFCVQCDEYRSGQKIGSVRRDFVLPVIDCPLTAPPTPLILVNSLPLQEAKLCRGTSLTLTTDQQPDWNYQWQRDGEPIEGARAASLTVVAAGVYTITKTFSTTCGRESTSAPTQVRVGDRPTVALRLLTADGSRQASEPFCEGDALLLSVSAVAAGDQYRWTSDGSSLGSAGPTLAIAKTGLYSLSVTPVGTSCWATTSRQVTFLPRPLATLAASSTLLCPGQTARLTTADQPGYQYRWEPAAPNAAATQDVGQGGTYRVTLTSAAGCSATSPAVTLVVGSLPVVSLTPVGSVCASSTPIPLQATPTGGTWSGNGILAGRFDPRQAGVGGHSLTYTASSWSGCQRQETLLVEVLPPLQLRGPTQYRLQRGTSVLLTQQPNHPGATIQWTPPDNLDRGDVATPLFSGVTSQTYTVVARTPLGCLATARVEVLVISQLLIPSGFSPNNDGQNDIWKPINVEGFPGCAVVIYNRWGEVVYAERGLAICWDGSYQQRPAEAGLYTYVLRTGSADEPVYRGQLTLLR